MFDTRPKRIRIYVYFFHITGEAGFLLKGGGFFTSKKRLKEHGPVKCSKTIADESFVKRVRDGKHDVWLGVRGVNKSRNNNM